MACAAQTMHWIYVMGTISKNLNRPELDFFSFYSILQKPLGSIHMYFLKNLIHSQRNRLMGTIAVKKQEAKQQ